jgi:hypothetical protein
MIRDQIYCNKKKKNLIRLNEQVVIHFLFCKGQHVFPGGERERGREERTCDQSSIDSMLIARTSLS